MCCHAHCPLCHPLFPPHYAPPSWHGSGVWFCHSCNTYVSGLHACSPRPYFANPYPALQQTFTTGYYAPVTKEGSTDEVQDEAPRG
jgi:hypothetical protein